MMILGTHELLQELRRRAWLPDDLTDPIGELSVSGEEEIGAWPLLEALVDQGWITQEQALALAADLVPLPCHWSPSVAEVDPQFLGQIPMEYAREHQVLPVRRQAEEVLVWISDPIGIETIQNQLSFLLGAPIAFALVPPASLDRTIHEVYYKHSATSESEIRKLEREDVKGTQPGALFAGATEDLLDMANRAPIVRLVNLILLEAVKAGASDVHFEPYEEVLKVRFRIDGVLSERSTPPSQHRAAIISRLKVMSGLNIAERRLPQDGRARIRIGGRELDIRVSSVPVRHGERLVLRILDRENQLHDLGELGMPAAMQTRFETILKRTHGLVLVTGPTGSGKTTTLYGALDRLDCERQNIITIEDPVEYQVASVSQIEIRPQIGLTFAHGLRHILRQDPDVVMVGEMRDLETAEISIRASLTGHLVLSTLHTNNSLEAIIRLQDMGIPRYLIAAASIGTIAQRLLRRLCTHCRIPVDTGFEADATFAGTAHAYHANEAGCSDCLAGYRGRVGVFEFLDWNETFRGLVHDGASAAALQEQLKHQGFISMQQDAEGKVRDGITSPEELWRVF